MRSFILVSLAAVILAASAAATRVRFVPWWELVDTAEFMGIVKCTNSGGLVSEHEVIDCWIGGEKAGNHIRVYESPNYWGSQFPIRLAEKTYFLVAYKNDAPDTILSTTFGGPVPLWWRNLKYDYVTPLGIPFRELEDQDDGFGFGGHEYATKAEARQAVLAFMALAPAEREARCLAEEFADSLTEWAYMKEETEEQAEQRLAQSKMLLPELKTTRTVPEVLDRLLAHAKGGTAAFDGSDLRYLAWKAGKFETLRWLGTKPAEDLPFDARTRADLVEELVTRCLPHLYSTWYPAKAAKRDKQHQEWRAKRETREKAERELRAGLDKLRAIFAEGRKNDDWGTAFSELSKRDPATVAAWLNNWRPGDNARFEYEKREEAYALASWFGSECGQDRVKHLKSLLKAANRTIRVAAAVYLCFDDEEAGIAALNEMTSEDDLDSLWAALNLARRGRKDAVPRAIDLLGMEVDKETGMSDEPYYVLRARLIVLLSNSAVSSGVPQPPIGDSSDQPLQHLLRKWWETHGKRVRLTDPWLEELRAQRID